MNDDLFFQKFDEARQYFNNGDFAYARDALFECLRVPGLTADQRDQVENLQLFVNERLQDAGIPTDPEPFGDFAPDSNFAPDSDFGADGFGESGFPDPPAVGDPFAGFNDTQLDHPLPTPSFAAPPNTLSPTDFGSPLSGGFGASDDGFPEPDGFVGAPSDDDVAFGAPPVPSGFSDDFADDVTNPVHDTVTDAAYLKTEIGAPPDDSETARYLPDGDSEDMIVASGGSGQRGIFGLEDEGDALSVSEAESAPMISAKMTADDDGDLLRMSEKTFVANKGDLDDELMHVNSGADDDDDDFFAPKDDTFLPIHITRAEVELPPEPEPEPEPELEPEPEPEPEIEFEPEEPEPEPAPVVVVAPPPRVSVGPPRFLEVAAMRGGVAAMSMPALQVLPHADYEIFAETPRAARSWLDLGSAVVLALHPWKMIYAIVGVALTGVWLGLLFSQIHTAEPSVLNLSAFGLGLLAWLTAWAIPPGLAHMTRAQIEGRSVPNPLRTLSFVGTTWIVNFSWPFAVAGVFGTVYIAVGAFGELGESGTDLAFLNYAMVLAAAVCLSAIGLGLYLPTAIVGMGRARRLESLTDRFFRLFRTSLLSILGYSTVILLMTVAACGVFVLIGYAVLNAFEISYAADGTWSTSWPVEAEQARLLTASWFPPFYAVYEAMRWPIAPETVAGLAAASPGAFGLALLYLFGFSICLAYGVSVFYTGGTLAYVLLRKPASRRQHGLTNQ